MTQQMQIKDPAAKGSTPTEIKEATGFSYPAIRKYLAKEDFSPKRPVKRTEESILDPYKPLLAKMFEEDRRIYHKQRHTAKRIHRRLVDEHGFEGSYSTVQRYAKELKAQARLEAAKGPFLGLEWPAGTMQVDSGRRPQRGVVRGHRLRQDPPELAVSGARDGHMVAAHSGLVNGPQHHGQAGRRGAEDSLGQAKQPEGLRASFGSRIPVRVVVAVQDHARA